MITVRDAVRRARRFLAEKRRVPIHVNTALIKLHEGEYRVSFTCGEVVHVDAESGTVMEPENGYRVTRR